jgi:uncharacterized protein YihD (DUF1040 family)
MRDVKRIPEILNELKGIWSSFPDLRLGQLILNVLNDPQLYYMEDDEIIKCLRDHYSEVKYIEAYKSNISNKG